MAQALRREGVAQHRMQPPPRGAELRHVDRGHDGAVGSQRHPSVDRHADRGIDPRAGTPQAFEQRRMDAEPGAPPGQRAGGPLDHDDVPAGSQQHAADEQPAERAADDERARHPAHHRPLGPSPAPREREGPGPKGREGEGRIEVTTALSGL